MRRLSRVILISTLTVGLAFTAAAPAAASPRNHSPSPPVPTLEWAPCGEAVPGAECATAAVPLDYAQPTGATTHIALARIPAADQANRIGSVFVNPGGPGGSGVDSVLGGFGQALGQQLEGRFDVVGFDPRGVARSEPLRCFDSQQEAAKFLAGVPFFPYQKEQYRPYFETARAYAELCSDGRHRISQHMSTADVARDLDLLRQAVGDAKLNYLGFSYGSYLGNTYANLFPQKIRTLVIDGVLDPRLWSSGRQIESDRIAIQKEFDEFLRLCDEAGPDCAFSAPEGSAARWESLATAIRRQPLALPDGSFFTYDSLILAGIGAMYAPEFWGGPFGDAALFDAVADAVSQGPAATAVVVDLRRSIAARVAAPAADVYDNRIDAYFGNQCGDTQFPRTLAQFRLTDRYAAAGSRFGPLVWWRFGAPCAAWPVNDDRYTGPWTARTANPVLVVGNFFDGITDYSGAQASARLLKSSRLLSYAGWGHVAYGRSACVTAHVNRYLIDGALPDAGTVCPANPNPFLPVAAQAAAGSAPLALSPTEFIGRPLR